MSGHLKISIQPVFIINFSFLITYFNGIIGK